MTSRSRPRGAQLKDDADEERSIWNQLRADAKKVDALVRESNEIEKRIYELGMAQQAIEARGDMPPADVDHELDDLVRKNIRLHEAISSLTDGSSSDSNMSITQGLELLSALRAASASSPDTISNGSRHASSKVQRNPKRNKIDHASNDDTDSIADSPKPSLSSGIKDRLGVGSSSKAGSRSTSVGAGRETSVKVEDGNDSMDSVKVSTVGDRHRLSVGTEVFYRNKQKNTEGEGILCSVTSVIGEGKQRRYEIIDSDPDPSTPLQPYRASVSNLVPIPISNIGLPELPLRKNVLAVYPGTTTFYKAEVVASRMGKGLKKDGKEIGGSLGELKDGFVRLRFEGEDEADREMDVERRYVLPETGR
ncbi:SAGA-associated factor 29 [Lasiodiplodia theobromae]|uniref:SAGA-associated factor 29 n=2 Tax=Lasiodiplodia TaxID=66739 RepID=A0A5N5CVM2_9PEZI|nr:SAGA-associated factor 29 [Lasiodiplodia theobromae]KAF9630421.1 SAGA-associated factor 29 [Lasiodiplodia theobromae]KAK0653535.1 SAGA-associated factor 29 [Lasiodiplodia hormozganensis]